MMTRRAVARGFGIAAILVAAVAVIWALRPAPIAVEMAVATRGPLTASVAAEGRTRVKSVYVVAAPVDGDLERIVYEPGDPVQPGAAVARIWPITPRPLDARSRAEAEAAVAAARAAVARAEASERETASALTHAESQLATARTLSAEGVTAPKDLEHAGHEAQIRREAMGAAGAAVQTARAELRRAEAIVAIGPGRAARPATLVPVPVPGHVLRVLRESAGPVTAGTPLVEIGDMTTIEVVADLLTADAMEVRPGAAAIIRDWGGPPPHSETGVPTPPAAWGGSARRGDPGPGAIAARVRRIDPAAFTKVSALGVEEQRVRAVLDLLAPAPTGLGHDFRVTVSIAVWQGQQVLTVPSTALFRSGDRWAVFAVRDGRVHVTPVMPGPSDGARTVIEDGLADGHAVVVQPSDVLSDGARVIEARRAP